MDSRDALINSILPVIHVDGISEMQTVERFMHENLRPILKFQDAIIIRTFINETAIQELPQSVDLIKKLIDTNLRKNKVLKQQLIGMVCGLLTEEKLVFYYNHRQECNKRITQMLMERIFQALFRLSRP
ncbi:MAG: hypothetical protein MUC81_05550 [Bacteroidia bacterium]|jgi:hypothetical protein|nr:hypothetical protein [Bacteroidia bacterium]